jgi:hypothetical protein
MDPQVAAQALGFKAETHLGVAAEASRPSGAGAVPTGAAFRPPNATVRIAGARPASRTREYTARRPRNSTVWREVCA